MCQAFTPQLQEEPRWVCCKVDGGVKENVQWVIYYLKLSYICLTVADYICLTKLDYNFVCSCMNRVVSVFPNGKKSYIKFMGKPILENPSISITTKSIGKINFPTLISTSSMIPSS